MTDADHQTNVSTTPAHVVTAFLRHRGEVLLIRRSDEVGTYAGLWGGISGYVEGDPGDAVVDARREIREETGLDDHEVELVRAGDPLDVRDERTGGDLDEWIVHPFLFDVRTREIDPNYEIEDTEWGPPTAILERETVPNLWATYRAVAPAVETIREDRTHGSAHLSVRALEVLRDAAGRADDWNDVAATAVELCETRPDMAAIANRIHRVMDDADQTPRSVHDRAQAAIEVVLEADDRAAANAAELLDSRSHSTVISLSRSGTVIETLRRARPAVVVAESRPGREGAEVAETLADDGLDVTITADAAIAAAIDRCDVDAALVGADAVLPDGSVVNKVGTRLLGLAATAADVPLYVVAARDKVTPSGTGDSTPESESNVASESESNVASESESADPATVYDDCADVAVFAPLFERTPPGLVESVVTETGQLDADDVSTVATEHRAAMEWMDRTGVQR